MFPTLHTLEYINKEYLIALDEWIYHKRNIEMFICVPVEYVTTEIQLTHLCFTFWSSVVVITLTDPVAARASIVAIMVNETC